MKKSNHSKTRLPAGAAEAIVVGIIILAVLLIILLSNLLTPSAEVPPIETETVGIDDVPTTLLSPDITLPMPLADGISLTGLYAVDALFPEDGSNRAVENLLCGVIRNDSDKTLEYMVFNLTSGGNTYEFSATTLPPASEMYVFEKNAAAAPEQIMELTADVPIQLFFSEEPELMEDQLEITVKNGTIDIKNITDAPMEHEIQVYYKNTENLAYFGGITYFLRVPAGLAPGETYSGYASNASTARSEVMFVKYGN